MGDAGPSSAGMDPEDMDGDDDMDETQALQIETAQPGGMPRRRGLLSKLLGASSPKKYGAVRSSTRQQSGGDAAANPIATLVAKFQECLGKAGLGALVGEVEEEPLLFALTWAQPQRYGIAPSPRNGHTMVLIGMHLYIFGGGDETISYNDVHTLHVGTMAWDKVRRGTPPLAAQASANCAPLPSLSRSPLSRSLARSARAAAPPPFPPSLPLAAGAAPPSASATLTTSAAGGGAAGAGAGAAEEAASR